jgi:predicted ribosome quality control (RQC) complex YloA/Tae2 family protein
MPITKYINIPNSNLTVEYIIGRTASDNFEIIDAAEEHHMWFHIEGQPSGHVIAVIDEQLDRKLMRSIIKQGAVACKQFSKYSSAKNVDIVYAKICDVKKTDIVGQVLVTNAKHITI